MNNPLNPNPPNASVGHLTGTLLGVYICAGSRMSLIVYQGDKFLGYKSTQIISKYPNNLANLRKLSLLIEMPYFVYMTCIVKETTSQ